MSIIQKVRKQKAIYWSYSGHGIDHEGRESFSVPVAIDCRWDDMKEEFFDDKGERQVSKSVVMVDREVRIGEFIKLGNIQPTTQNNPHSENGTFRIRGVAVTPNFKATEFLRRVYL